MYRELESNGQRVVAGAELLGVAGEFVRCPRIAPGRMRWSGAFRRGADPSGEIEIENVGSRSSGTTLKSDRPRSRAVGY